MVRSVKIRRFRNFVDPEPFTLEPGVTALVGKNESGKSTALHALYRLKPANSGYSRKFNLTNEYPRWRLAPDRRKGDLDQVSPIEAVFELEDDDRNALSELFGVELPEGLECRAGRRYDNTYWVSLTVPVDAAIKAGSERVGVDVDDVVSLSEAEDIAAASKLARELSASYSEKGDASKSAALKKVPAALKPYLPLVSSEFSDEQLEGVWDQVPSFFYFSNYAVLPGTIDLHALLEKDAAKLSESEETARSLLAFAGVTGSEFLDDAFESRKAELEAASIDLSRQVFEYWRQNQDLTVEFADDYKQVSTTPEPNPQPVMHRMLDIRLRDLRHGGVTTNFSTRSSGFQWFFSFLAAFSGFEHSERPVVVLLDEPGTSLHGEAQRDFLRFIFERLGDSQQVVYTTHSQHMVEPTQYETLRAVEDRATRTDPDRGALVSEVRLSADRDTVLPVQAALGYSISQHLFLGAYHHVLVEGGSDFVYLTEMTNHLARTGGVGLDGRLALLPVGGVDKMPPFVALLGRHLTVSVLMDGGSGSKHSQRLRPLVEDGVILERRIVHCSDVSGVPSSSDIEDLFSTTDYLRLFNWGFGTKLTESDLPNDTRRLITRMSEAYGDDFDHGVPAAQLAEHRDEFFSSLDAESLRRFTDLMVLLNETL